MRCPDCDVKTLDEGSCYYCNERPPVLKGACVICEEPIEQSLARYRLFGNYCFECDQSIEQRIGSQTKFTFVVIWSGI